MGMGFATVLHAPDPKISKLSQRQSTKTMEMGFFWCLLPSKRFHKVTTTQHHLPGASPSHPLTGMSSP